MAIILLSILSMNLFMLHVEANPDPMVVNVTFNDFDVNMSTCSSKAKLMSIKHGHDSMCKPMETLVKPDIKGLGDFTLVRPKLVKTNLCSGHCSFASCNPVSLGVKVYDILLENCSNGTCQHSCSQISVDNHIACECSCPQSVPCNASIKVFNSETCSCECRNSDTFTDCKVKNNLWDNKQCRCFKSYDYTIVPGVLQDLADRNLIIVAGILTCCFFINTYLMYICLRTKYLALINSYSDRIMESRVYFDNGSN